MAWDLWIDYHRTDGAGLTHAALRNAREGASIAPGEFIVVGNEDADPAVAAVVSVAPDGVVLVRVLPGSFDANRSLLSSQRAGSGRPTR